MIKQHTPKYIIQEFRSSVDIWDIDGQKCICSNFHLPETRNDSKNKMEFVLNVLNNHDRLVDALDTLVNTSIDGSGNHFDAWHKAKQLLTEINK